MSDSTPPRPKGPAKRQPIERARNIQQANPSDINATKDKPESLQLPPSNVTPKRPDDDVRSEPSPDSSQNAELTDDEAVVDNDSRKDRSSVPREAVPLKLEPPVPPLPKPDHRGQSNRTFFVYIAVALVIIAVAIGGCCMYQPFQTQATPAKRPSCKHFLQLKSKYPNTDEALWTSLIVSVDRATNNNPGEPGTFIFLYNSFSVGKSLLDDVTRIAIKCFGSGGAIWRTFNHFETVEIKQNHSTALDLYREELQSQKVLVVQELDRVPPNAAQVFFPICDSYTPLVHRAVIFFTIDVSGQPRQENRSATAVAEGILKGLWREELKPDVLDPLLVRLTENVFRID